MPRGTTGSEITFVGHVSKDVNVVKGRREIIPGGGVYYGSFAARSLGAKVKVVTKLNLNDKELFSEMESFGIKVVWIPSCSTTSIENVYPSDNPDERISRMVSKADPFTEGDIENLSGIVHITPLWHGEFPEQLLERIRPKVKVLGGDAQGFLRNVSESGEMFYERPKSLEFLKFFNVFKLDSKEALVLTGKEGEEALMEIASFGVEEIVLTTKEGVYVHRDGKIAFARFGEWKMEGRTGRGDTAIASYLVLRREIDDTEKLAEEVARITTLKMQRKGPYKGW